MARRKILVLNGPNLNMLGLREPDIYGHETLKDLEKMCQSYGGTLGFEVECRQSNHEGDLVTWCQQARENHDGILINAGAYTHTSVALHDALLASEKPVIEVHISNIYKREAFRHKSYISPIAKAVVCGMGLRGYKAALDHFADFLEE